MPAINHPSYAEELERCKYTLGYVEKSLESTLHKKDRVDGDLQRVRKHFNAENSQDYIDMIVNTTIKGGLDVKLRNLITARSKPYFARVDFKEAGKNGAEKLYIGKMCLIRDEDQKLMIIDWRAPAANLYYEGRLGKAEYVCPEGTISGELVLKRQFSINSGVLQEIFDIDITTNDEFLQTYLGANADNRLKEIVSTIQTEQNAIVRADMWKPLIVQGAAGSGKTTIALHRIAYLIYNYEKNFQPENFMIIAPNRLFLNYISEVLPELGVEKVRQTTFEDFAQELIGKKFKIRDANEKLIALIRKSTCKDDAGKIEEAKYKQLLKKCSEFKTSMQFKDLIDDYVSMIERNFIPVEDFKIGKKVIFTYNELNDLFINQYKMWPIAQRINEIKKSLTNRLSTKKTDIINQLYDDCDRIVNKYRTEVSNQEERQMRITAIIKKRDGLIGKVESYSKTMVAEYIKRIAKFSPYEYYKELVNNAALFEKAAGSRADAGLIEFTRKHTAEILKSGCIEIEDIAPIIYLKFRIYGMDEKIPVRHIVIDEAQDFSAFQIFVIKKIVKDSSFTILGDLNQGIHSYRGIRDWNDITENVFNDRRNEFLTLERSYRTTVEIMEAANKVISKLNGREEMKAKPVIRHREKVGILPKATIEEIMQDIGNKISVYKDQSFKSMAVICKTLDECNTVHAKLSKLVSGIYIVNGKDEAYNSGIVIVPSYLAKGLEFDIVFIANAGSDIYTEDELDVKLLYVAMTRPLHKLFIYHLGELSPLLV